jgi:predicted component of type VI protein secretion system
VHLEVGHDVLVAELDLGVDLEQLVLLQVGQQGLLGRDGVLGTPAEHHHLLACPQDTTQTWAQNGWMSDVALDKRFDLCHHLW